MNIDEWKVKLKPAGVLLALYFVIPALIGWMLGAYDKLAGGFAISDLLQAGLAGGVLYHLYKLKDGLTAELTGWLGQKGQPRDKTRELAEAISSLAKVVAAVGLLLPPLDGVFQSRGVLTLVKFMVAAYIAYDGYAIWKLSEPFMRYVHPDEAAERNKPDAPPAEPIRRCPKCNQVVTARMTVCAFCKEPVQK